MAVIAIPSPLREQLGDKATEAFVSVLKELDRDSRENALAVSEEKYERRLLEESSKIRQDIARMEGDIKVLKWMMGVMVAGIASLVMKAFFA